MQEEYQKQVMEVMIMRSEEDIRDKIEDLSYIFDISDDLMVRYLIAGVNACCGGGDTL
jgi:hypothetical protein